MPLIIRPPAYGNWLSIAVAEPADIARLAVPDAQSFAVTPYGWNDSHSRLARPIHVSGKRQQDDKSMAITFLTCEAKGSV